jgi:hypothetical protein
MNIFKPEPQPAYELYPVDRGWRVLKYVSENLFARTAKEAETWYRRGREYMQKSKDASDALPKYFQACVAGGLFLAGGAQYLSAVIFAGLFVVIQTGMLSIWFAAAVVAIACLALYTKAYALYYRAYFRCPGCHAAMDVPVFLCPCGTGHTRLWPSLYGILHHTCKTCGQQLPTTEWNGRRAIERRCASCSTPLVSEVGELENIHIPVVGGPYAGKSNLLVSAVHELMQRGESTQAFAVTLPDPTQQRDFQANVARLASGRELTKTTEIVPQAYTLALQEPGRRVGRLLYIYDAAGEAYSNEVDALNQIYFQYVHGLLFVIDPFSIHDLIEELGGQVESVRTSLRPSPITVMESYERMLTVLETKLGLVRHRAYYHPLSVVVTKVDAFDLESKIGAPAARAMRVQNSALSEADAMNTLVRDFLIQYGLENLVRDIERQFSSVRFFSASALGRMPGMSSSQFVPVRALDPVLSILQRRGILNSKKLAAAGVFETQGV